MKQSTRFPMIETLIVIALTVLVLALTAPAAHAETVTVDFTVASEWDNGDTLDPDDIRSSRFYCDGGLDPVAAQGGSASGQFVFDLPDGTHPCYAAHTLDRSAFVAKQREVYNDPTFDPACLEADQSNSNVNPEVCLGEHRDRTIIIGAVVLINVNGPDITITVQ